MPNDIESISYIQVGENNHPIDAVTINGKTIPGDTSLLPDVTNADEGKVLRVINGQWTLVTPVLVHTGDGIPDSQTGNDGDIYIQYTD